MRQVRLEAANSKASAIVEQDDLSGRAKAKEVAKLYAKAKDGKGKKKGKPSRGDKYKKKGPPLDRFALGTLLALGTLKVLLVQYAGAAQSRLVNQLTPLLRLTAFTYYKIGFVHIPQ